jgi:amino acid permease
MDLKRSFIRHGSKCWGGGIGHCSHRPTFLADAFFSPFFFAFSNPPRVGLLFPDPWESHGNYSQRYEKYDTFGIVVNLVNSITGPSLFLAPFAFYSSGIVGGLLLLLIAIGLQFVSVYMLVVAAHLSGRSSYRGLMGSLVSKSLPRVADLLCCLYSFAMIVLHLILVRDVLPILLSQWANTTVNIYLPTCIFCLVILLPPMLFARKLKLMTIPSVAAFVCCLFIIACIIYAYISGSLTENVRKKKILFFRLLFFLLPSRYTRILSASPC